MPSSSAPAVEVPSAPNPAIAQRSTDLLIGLLVPPVLVGLLTARLMADGLTQAGLVSEQLLQGQRLPHLNIHAPQSPH